MVNAVPMGTTPVLAVLAKALPVVVVAPDVGEVVRVVIAGLVVVAAEAAALAVIHVAKAAAVTPTETSRASTNAFH
jgi:hypothetical protein